MEITDHDVHAVTALDYAAAVGKSHPIGLAGYWSTALAELADLFEGRYDQFGAGLWVDQGWLGLLVVERFGFFGVHDAIAEADEFTGFGIFDVERVDAPDQAVIETSAIGDGIRSMVVRAPGRLRGGCAGRSLG